MNRNTILKVLNPLLGLLILNQLITGTASESLSHEAFEFAHEGGGIVLAVGVLLHVILNWKWIKANYLKKSTTPREAN